MTSHLLTSPLHDRHVALGAKMADFGGWEMPIEYPGGGVVREHTAVRERVGLFDVSHLGKASVRGPGAAEFVNACLTNDLGRIAPGKAQYTLCCDEAGGVVDDLIAYLVSDDEVFLVPNAANTAEVVRRLQAAAPEGVTVTGQHQQYAVLAVQGSKSDEVLDAIGFPTGHEYMSFAETEFEDTGVVVCRTGYTGERGYELIARNEVAGVLWDRLLDAGAAFGMLPCGLGARDTLRTEMGYPLHGQDITIDVTPNQAGLGWAVGWRKAVFWGRDALAREKAEGPKRKLRGLLALERGIPRPGMIVSLVPDVPLCEITSGTFSPTLKKGIGMALVPTFVDPEAELGVQIRTRREIFASTKPPFVDTSVREA
jgi:aminomethyltransferase